MLATSKREHQALRQVLALLAKTGVIPGAAAALDNSMQTVASTLRDAVLAEIPAFSASGNPEIIPGLDQHRGEHIQEIRRLFGGGELGDLEFVRTHAHPSRGATISARGNPARVSMRPSDFISLASGCRYCNWPQER